MVLHKGDRPLTVEEVKALPPPTEDEMAEIRAQRRAALEEGAALSAAILARRGGIPISDEELERALSHDDNDDCD